MRILVVSDTHGHVAPLAAVAGRIGRVDRLLHAGDFIADIRPVGGLFGLSRAQCRGVAGNCDYPVTQPAEALVELEGVRILLTHGHTLDVKRTVQRLFARALDQRARIAIFGHSHQPMLSDEAGIMLLNPGSVSFPRRPGPGSCALLDLADGDIRSAMLIDVD